jgi:phospholipid-binding lipoprotein MlaA
MRAVQFGVTARGPIWRGMRSAALCAVLLTAASSALAETKIRDPLEKLNRATYKFNDALDRMALRPVARLYRAVVPKPVRGAVSNFLVNLRYPTTVLNDFLQVRFTNGFSDSARFIVNTTIGIGGLFDPASHFGLQRHEQDFGQTLGHWGVPSGPYLVLPLLGPSDFRDAPAKYVDHYADPIRYLPARLHRTRLQNIEYGLTAVDSRAGFLSIDEMLRSSFDPYVVVRNSYLKHRDYLIHGGVGDEEALEPPPEDPEPPAPPPAP